LPITLAQDLEHIRSHDRFLQNGMKLNQPMFVDGIFEIAPLPKKQSLAADDRVILICRSGRLFGADPHGRIYRGVLYPAAARTTRKSRLKAVYEVPLKSKRLSGRVPALNRIPVPISGEIDPWARCQNATVRIGHKPIDIEITYIGPLP
jgi:hypothetical protein